MTPIDLLLWWMALYGVTFTLCDAKLLERPRSWLTSRSTFLNAFLDCYFCVGFWVSIFAGLLRFWSQDGWAHLTLLHGFAGASWCFAFNSLLLTLEQHARHPPQE